MAAQTRLPAIIGDNMVLQRGIPAPVWGWAAAGEKISVVFENKTYTTVAAADGKWMLKLDAARTGGPYQMTVKAKDSSMVIHNILVGDVWLASGQSNMEFGIQTDSYAADAIAGAGDSLIRFFYVPMASSLQPINDIQAVPDGSLNGKWIICSPGNMAKNWAWHGFSAIGYYFAREIRAGTASPVGMIGSYKGATPAQAWVSLQGLRQDTGLSHYINMHQKLLDNYEQAKKDYPRKQEDFRAAMQQWNAETGKADSAGGKAVVPVNVKKIARPPAPPSPDGGFGAPANLYNAMIKPLVPYAIKGVIWYQGESNGDRIADAIEYPVLFPRLIKDWREQWQQGDFPFLFVQLTNFRAPAKKPAEGIWPWVREAQLKTLSLSNTGMAVTTDIGNADSIHPTNKLDVGLRLALAARHIAYHENIVYSGPVYASMKITGNKIRLVFRQEGGGLVIGRPPGQTVELRGFGIAGADKQFAWARAELDGNTVVVYSDEIDHPVAVRYNWADNPPGNLYNKEGLPATPFRTDNWPY